MIESRSKRHVVPKFGRSRLADVSLATLMEWIDEQRAAGELSESSILHNMNFLSRFYSWAIARGKAIGAREVLLKKKGDKIANEVKPTMTWYQATRHSFVSRHLSRGA